MSRKIIFQYQTLSGELKKIELERCWGIRIHFRFPDGAKLIEIEGLDKKKLIPPEVADEFLRWLSQF
jgi:hypothetical protein